MLGNERKTLSVQYLTGEHVDHDAQTYLRVAEAVLADALTPLKAREIVDRGIERDLFGDHALSRTPEKSMQARLSMDILKVRDNSARARCDGRGADHGGPAPVHRARSPCVPSGTHASRRCGGRRHR